MLKKLLEFDILKYLSGPIKSDYMTERPEPGKPRPPIGEFPIWTLMTAVIGIIAIFIAFILILGD
jgi:hypothetical protein